MSVSAALLISKDVSPELSIDRVLFGLEVLIPTRSLTPSTTNVLVSNVKPVAATVPLIFKSPEALIFPLISKASVGAATLTPILLLTLSTTNVSVSIIKELLYTIPKGLAAEPKFIAEAAGIIEDSETVKISVEVVPPTSTNILMTLFVPSISILLLVSASAISGTGAPPPAVPSWL